ncbi:MAG TPA: TonB-dependent receptor, partial [Gemmatimonadales bacterium]|nr:TonB-dependent receptor [Gemmatimonadales bacterium]
MPATVAAVAPPGADAHAAPAALAADATTVAAAELSAITVTGTREERLLAETPASVGVIRGKDIRLTGPTHPQQILGQVPGVSIGVTNGEGHTTAIRQPFTTGPLYLFLEDGVPIRATGFFNHNALYEVNIPAAGGLEVVRGPGTALYGSDAIGGTVNVLTRAPSSTAEAGVSAEAGSFGWARLLADGSTGVGAGAVRGAVNLTHTDGWRDATAYDRQSLNLRWDTELGAAQAKTIFGFTSIDQQTGANSPLPLADYRDDPTRNNMPIAYRKVQAARLSTQLDHESGATLASVTPYLRFNTMELNGTFNLSFDPRIEKSEVTSVGVMAKWRRDFAGAARPRLILGVDVDHSTGTRTEDSLVLTRSGSGADTMFTDYTLGNRIYDYEVTFDSLSPYVHAEASPTPDVRLTAGLRHDSIRYRMENNLDAEATRAGPRVYAQLPHTTVEFSHWSPKLGATWAVSPAASLYASYNHGFRTPSEGQLFRAGSAANAADAASKAQLALALQPIKANQFEVGVRGSGAGWTYDAVAYQLVKRDDLVSQRDLATNVATSVNAGKTRHRGIELGLGRAFAHAWHLDMALSYAKHTYVRWETASADLSGKEIEAAPRVIANTRLTWAPRDGSSVQLEWVRIGSYWLEAGNSPVFGKYPGPDVFNLRASRRIGSHLSL